ncbi:hypothetical protein HZY62_18915 [Maribacter polysiphoniae]|uniref:Parallel beta helix pectate lyase-like protein n=1 Tax=Maribacter polysiphoniae TaxID=429344 RepID=A0A316DSV2_9FLAO|nr:Ig-like domain-containing protein [Maribacter polysiphoniae]MBD1262676.1 hypothetical protein [Maribacter polysiphoniae]PWK21124.1 hypothetical protein LX92_03925 [Maribacter polysiphoniae]
MKFNTPSPLKVLVLIFVFILHSSCSKDSDLMTDYVLSETQNTLDIGQLIIDDTFEVSSPGSITLDVLANDAFENQEEVLITETSTPSNGTVEINTDNTLTYTPNLEVVEQVTETTDASVSEVVDTFTYTTEVVNEDESVSTDTGNVIVTVGTSANRAPITGDNVYYVTTSGKSNNNGASEATAWNIQHAFSAAKAGDVVYIKAGNYGALSLSISNSGTADNPIQFIGYTSTPEDLIAINGSTFSYGDVVNAAIMPLLNGDGTGTGITVSNNVVLENIQIKDYSLGLILSGSNSTLNNIIAIDLGNQGASGYDGFGIRVSGSYNTIKNSYIANATAEAFKVYGGTNNLIQYLEVRADNVTNPCDYYVILTNTSNNIVEDSRVERAPGLAHGGHGLTSKWNSKNNIFRRCETVYTNLDLNFEDVTGNLYEDIRMIGQGTSGSYWHTNIDLRNGANGNTFRNIYMTDVNVAVTFTDDNDGFTPSPDSDVVKLGYNNRFENLIVENAATLVQFNGNTNIGGVNSAPGNDNIFVGGSFTNIGTIVAIYNDNSGNGFINSTFKNTTTLVSLANGKPNNISFTNCIFE